MKTQLHTSHVITKVQKKTAEYATQASPPLSVSKHVQNDLGISDALAAEELREQLQAEEEKFYDLQSRVCPLTDVEQAQIEMEKQMVILHNKIDQFQTLIEFERDLDSYSDVSKGTQLLDTQEIDKLRKLPPKPSNLSNIMDQYESEYAYIKSLNLSETIADIFRTLEKSLERVSTCSGQQTGLSFNYDLMQTMGQQKDYLDSFSDNFARFTTRLVSLYAHSTRTAQLHESLAQQNQVLFQENCSLHKQLLDRNQQSQASLPVGHEGLSRKEQKRIVKEVSLIIQQHLNLLRSQVFSQSPVESQLPHLPSLPLEDPSVFKLVQANIDLISELREGLKLRLDQATEKEQKTKLRLTRIMENYQVFKTAFDQLLQKQLPRCKALLKIDAEYLRRTLAENKEAAEEALKHGDLASANVLNLVRCHEQVVQQIDKVMIAM